MGGCFTDFGGLVSCDKSVLEFIFKGRQKKVKENFFLDMEVSIIEVQKLSFTAGVDWLAWN